MRMRLNGVARADEDLDHVGEVVFVRGIVGADLAARASRTGRRGSNRSPCWLRGWRVARAWRPSAPRWPGRCRAASRMHAAVAGGIVHVAVEISAPAASDGLLGRDQRRRAFAAAPAGSRRRGSPGGRPAAPARPRRTINAWPVPFCSVCSMKPTPRRCDGARALLRPGGPPPRKCAPAAPAASAVSHHVLRPASRRRRDAALWPCAISCGCPDPPPESRL